MAGIDLTGQRFGRLVVIGRDETRRGCWKVYWRCKCDCGGEKSTITNHLRSGNTRSCGCYMRDRTLEANLKHGQSYRRGSRRKPTRLYTVWQSMKSRCHNPSNQDYARYGGRGIAVCERWLNDFLAFEHWALSNGYAANLTIGRIDNDGGYSPDNCQWETAKSQARNRSTTRKVTYLGKTRPIAELAEQAGLNPKTVYRRIFTNGWSVDKALSTPLRGW